MNEPSWQIGRFSDQRNAAQSPPLTIGLRQLARWQHLFRILLSVAYIRRKEKGSPAVKRHRNVKRLSVVKCDRLNERHWLKWEQAIHSRLPAVTAKRTNCHQEGFHVIISLLADVNRTLTTCQKKQNLWHNKQRLEILFRSLFCLIKAKVNLPRTKKNALRTFFDAGTTSLPIFTIKERFNCFQSKLLNSCWRK